jgi:lectin, mannose-binding 2
LACCSLDMISLFIIASILLQVYGHERTLLRENSLLYPFKLQNWDFSGSAFIVNDKIVLTKDQPDEKGMLWNRIPLVAANWEVILSFKVRGQEKLYGDGMALWYMEKYPQPGHAFGCQEKFEGLGIFLDTFNNANTYEHEFPYISAMINDGNMTYQHDVDGGDDVVKGCPAFFRNLNQDTSLLVRYEDRRLSIFHNIDAKSEWVPCFHREDVILPPGNYLSVSSMTGQLYDFHEIHSITTFEIKKTIDDAVYEPDDVEERKEEHLPTLPTQKEENEVPIVKKEVPPIETDESSSIWYIFGLICVVVILLVLLKIAYKLAVSYHMQKTRFY